MSVLGLHVNSGEGMRADGSQAEGSHPSQKLIQIIGPNVESICTTTILLKRLLGENHFRACAFRAKLRCSLAGLLLDASSILPPKPMPELRREPFYSPKTYQNLGSCRLRRQSPSHPPRLLKPNCRELVFPTDQ